jgi:adenine-specific DNA-methyltransferase
VLDTKFFGREFKDRFLASFENLDEQTDGLLIHSENFQALTLLRDRFRDSIGCIFIDPPYNTGTGDFNYKDEYQHSTWLTMMLDRISLARDLLSKEGALFQTIDDNEYHRLKAISDYVFGATNFISTAVWQKRYVSNNTAKFISDMHDYVLVHANDPLSFRVHLQPRTEEQLKAYRNPDNDPRGVWRPQDLSASKPYSAGRFEIITPTGMRVSPPPGRYWRCSEQEYKRLLADNRITFGLSGEGRPMLKAFLSEAQEGVVPNTWWTRDETGDNKGAKLHLKSLFYPEPPFATPKPKQLIEKCLQLTAARLCLDFFAGSGTTAEAVISLSRVDGLSRKYIMIESGTYFDTVLRPRIQKIIYSKDWKDGRPISREGSSHLFKYIRLESYEDALNNIEMRRNVEQASLLEAHEEFREDYMLRYMLDVEARGSASLLNIEEFADPFNYQLNIATGASVGETRPVAVDLVETFNYLLGLRVRRVETVCGFRVVKGTNPEGEKVLVIWRNTREKSNDDLDQFFSEQGYNARDREFDIVYTNGDNNLENLRRPDETWKVRLIEESFQRLMFDVQDV